MSKPSAFSPALMCTMVAWAFNFVGIKIAYEVFTPADFAIARWVLMEVALLGLCFAFRKSLKPVLPDWLKIVGLGMISTGLYQVLFLEGIHLTTVAEGSIIMASGPIMTMLLAIAFGQEKFNLGVLGAALIAFVGVVLVVAKGGVEGRLLGDSMVFLAAALWALSAVLMRPLLAKHEPLPLTTLSMIGGIPFLIGYAFLKPQHTHWTAVLPLHWSMAAQAGILSGALGFWFFYFGMNQVGATGAMLYQYTVPPMAMGLAYVLLGTAVTWFQILGVLIVFGGVVLAVKLRSRSQPAITGKLLSLEE